MIYLDSCLIIYGVEEDTERGERVRAKMLVHDGELTISPLVIMECLVMPLRLHDEVLRRKYERIFSEFRHLPIVEATFRRAAELAAEHRLKAPDALHLATALDGDCDRLWTNDHRLARAAGAFAVAVV